MGTTDSQSERDFLIAVISAGSAIGGALLGSFFTYKYGTKIENENEKQRREKEKQEVFHRRIGALVRYELNAYSEFLDNIDKKSTEVSIGTNPRKDDRRINAEEVRSVSLQLSTYPKQYRNIPAETKIKVFNPGTWTRIEAAYNGYQKFASILEERLSWYDIHFQVVQINKLKQLINDALGSF